MKSIISIPLRLFDELLINIELIIRFDKFLMWALRFTGCEVRVNMLLTGASGIDSKEVSIECAELIHKWFDVCELESSVERHLYRHSRHLTHQHSLFFLIYVCPSHHSACMKLLCSLLIHSLFRAAPFVSLSCHTAHFSIIKRWVSSAHMVCSKCVNLSVLVHFT